MAKVPYMKDDATAPDDTAYWNDDGVIDLIGAAPIINFNDANTSIGLPAANTILRRTSGTSQETLNGSGAFRWHAYGAGTLTTDASGNITAVSDERLKTDIRDLPCGLDEVLKLHPVLHKWRPESGMDTENDYAGFIAQEVGKAMSCGRYRKTREDKNGKSIDESDDDKVQSYSLHAIVGALVNAVQQLNAQVEDLKKSKA